LQGYPIFHRIILELLLFLTQFSLFHSIDNLRPFHYCIPTAAMNTKRPPKISTSQRLERAAPFIEACCEFAEDYIDRLEAYLEVKGIRLPENRVTNIGWNASDQEFMLRAIMNLNTGANEMILKAKEFTHPELGILPRKALVRYFINHPFASPKFYNHIIWHEDVKALDIELYTIIEQKREEITALKIQLQNIM